MVGVRRLASGMLAGALACGVLAGAAACGGPVARSAQASARQAIARPATVSAFPPAARAGPAAATA